MKLLSRQGFIEAKEDDLLPIKVVGLVQTSLFKVNVAWYFFLNQDRQIVVAKVKLLASPQELLKIKVTDEEMRRLNLVRRRISPQWNYCLQPRTSSNSSKV